MSSSGFLRLEVDRDQILWGRMPIDCVYKHNLEVLEPNQWCSYNMNEVTRPNHMTCHWGSHLESADVSQEGRPILIWHFSGPKALQKILVCKILNPCCTEQEDAGLESKLTSYIGYGVPGFLPAKTSQVEKKTWWMNKTEGVDTAGIIISARREAEHDKLAPAPWHVHRWTMNEPNQI